MTREELRSSLIELARDIVADADKAEKEMDDTELVENLPAYYEILGDLAEKHHELYNENTPLEPFHARVYFSLPNNEPVNNTDLLIVLGTLDGPQYYAGGDYYVSQEVLWPQGHNQDTFAIKGKTWKELRLAGFKILF